MGSINLIRVLKRGWRVLAVFGALGLIIGAVSATITPDPELEESNGIYAASTVLRVGGELSIPLNASTQYLLAPDVAEQVASEIGGDPIELARHIVGTTNQQLNTVAITAVDRDADRAEQLADSFAAAFSDELLSVEQQRTEGTANAALQRATELLQEIDQIRTLMETASAQDLPLFEGQLNARLKAYEAAETERVAAASLLDGTSVAVEREAVAEPINRDNFDAYVQRITGSSSQRGKNKNASGPTPEALTLADALKPPSPPEPPNPLTRGLGGLGAGLLLGAVVLVATDRMDPRLRTKEQAEEVCGYPVVAEIPPLSRRQRLGTDVLAADEPLSRAAEAYRVLRSAILFAATAEDPNAEQPVPPQVLLVTSPGPSEGKTTTTANLAAVLAEAGYSVLVVNCDFRRPRVKDYLGVAAEGPRVSETRIKRVHLVDHVVQDEQLTNPAEIAAAQRRVIRTARDMFDVVILDTAPLLTTNDATELLALADLVLVVAQAGRTNAASAERAAELLERRRAKVLGVVLVGATDVPTARYYYYSSDVDVQPEAEVDPEALLDGPGPEATDPDLADELRSLSVPERRAPER